MSSKPTVPESVKTAMGALRELAGSLIPTGQLEHAKICVRDCAEGSARILVDGIESDPLAQYYLEALNKLVVKIAECDEYASTVTSLLSEYIKYRLKGESQNEQEK